VTSDAVDAPQIEGRLNATLAVRQIVQAVWALARAQLPRVERAAAEAAHYLDWVDAVVDNIAGPPHLADGERLTVILGPERAFCGGLPHQLLDQAPAGWLGLVGRRLSEAAHLRPELMKRVRFELPGVAHTGELARAANEVAVAILAHRDLEQVEVWHPIAGGARLKPVVLLAGTRALVESPPETYSTAEQILEAAIREGVRSHLLIGLVESMRSEVRARLALSESARLACDRRAESLTTTLRVLRQEEITLELAELAAGRLAAEG
jgi:F-type H+-transporting ATPase subunit gamma